MRRDNAQNMGISTLRPDTQPNAAAPTRLLRRERIVELDSLRGIAAGLVLVYHFTNWPTFHQEKIRGLPYIAWGRHGVVLFFVISGYVIFMTATSGGPREFLTSRIARLFPAYWFCVMLTYVVTSLHAGIAVGFYNQPPGLAGAAFNLTMLQKFFNINDIDDSYWTLALELSFYGYILLLVAASNLHRIELWCLAWLMVDVIGIVYDLPPPFDAILLLERGHLFIAGMMLFRIHENPRRWLSWLVLGVAASWTVFFSQMYSSTWFELAAIALVAVAVFRRPAILRLRILLWGGTLSYPLYLIHQNIGFVVMYWLHAAGLPQLAIFSIAVATSILLAALISQYVDIPGQRVLRKVLRDRLFYKAEKGPSIVPPG
jgi:peptidoglycan/LPS O-acetylase OafA/YrhL